MLTMLIRVYRLYLRETVKLWSKLSNCQLESFWSHRTCLPLPHGFYKHSIFLLERLSCSNFVIVPASFPFMPSGFFTLISDLYFPLKKYSEQINRHNQQGYQSEE